MVLRENLRNRNLRWRGHIMRAGEAPDASDANKKARDDAWQRWKSLLAQ
jgi:hypothetical protein